MKKHNSPRHYLKRIKRERDGFTLIELLVVIMIIAILAALIVPRVVNKTSDAKRSKAASDIANLRSALNHFRLDCDRYPSTEEGLEALRTAPSDATNWRGPYLDRPLPPDPWTNAYVYENTGNDNFSVLSYGADGAPGGDGENSDIGADEVQQ